MSAADASAQREFAGSDFRSTVGAFATGVTVITTCGREAADADFYGMTANAFSSVSLDPPLVLVCVISGTAGAETIERNGVFAVNVLGAHQEPISRFFSSRDRPSGRAAFAGLPHFAAVTGAPILERAAAYLDCRVTDRHEAGDHLIFIGEVVALGVDPEVRPLLFHGGGYAALHEAE
jgi:flavin reductase